MWKSFEMTMEGFPMQEGENTKPNEVKKWSDRCIIRSGIANLAEKKHITKMCTWGIMVRLYSDARLQSLGKSKRES